MHDFNRGRWIELLLPQILLIGKMFWLQSGSVVGHRDVGRDGRMAVTEVDQEVLKLDELVLSLGKDPIQAVSLWGF